MIQRVKNILTINCSAIDFTTLTDLTLYLKQGELFFEYAMTASAAHSATVTIPKADALKLAIGSVSIQFAGTKSANNEVIASECKQIPVDIFLKETGYGS